MNAADERRASLIHRESSKAGLRGKINAKCIECIFDADGGGGSWRQQVEECTSVTCPLFSVRPVSSSSSEVEA